jgi:Lon protease-like protein
MLLPLHIFEDRYKTMIRDCLGSAQVFGVVLAKNKRAQAPDVGGVFVDDLYDIGTTAHISAVEHYKDGRMTLITVGQDRFILRDIHPSQDDFLIGRVDPLPMEEDNLGKIDYLMPKLRLMVKRYIDHLADASGEDLSEATLPADPTALAFLAGTAVQGPLPDKQKLLSSRSLTTLISNTVNILDREDQILAYMLRAYRAHQEVERLPFIDYSLN